MSTISPQLVSTIRAETENNRPARYWIAAYELIKFYTGIEFREYMFSEFPISNDCPSEQRLAWLAASLHMLRDDDIFEELCRRLRDRDIRPTYFEISAACFCREIGFSVIPSPGIRKRGSDYDFSIMVDQLFVSGPLGQSEKVNVEVTELQSTAFDTKRVVSSLNAKRRQLPNDAANMIFCKIPQQWVQSSSSIGQDLDRVAAQFFRTSKRVNVIVFMSEHWSHHRNTYGVQYTSIITQNVRHRSDRLNISINEYFRTTPKTVDDALNNPANNTDYPRFRLRDFTLFVDEILA